MDFRDTLVSRYGADFCREMSRASVAVCGLGGLGSNIAAALVRMGVGRLHIVDFDRVEMANLSRQMYFGDQVGMLKTRALYQTLRRINGECQISCSDVRLDRGNIPEILRNDAIICEALDSAETKAELVNCVRELMPEKYLVCASGMAGFGDANLVKTRKIGEKFFVCGDGASEVSRDSDLSAGRVMVCAGHQAHKIVQIISKGWLK